MKKLILIFTFCYLNHLSSICQEVISINQSEMAKKINTFRTSNGKAILNLSFGLCKAAELKAKSLQEKGQAINLESNLTDVNNKSIFLKVSNIDANTANTFPTLTMKNAALEFWKVILEEESFAGKN